LELAATYFGVNSSGDAQFGQAVSTPGQEEQLPLRA
jgi:hypothetical protein